MKPIDSVEIVENFWAAVWRAQNPEAIDRFVVADFVLTTGGVDVVSGKNNGLMGTPADQTHISFTGIAVWEVRGDGKLCHNWVERSFFEFYQQLHPAVALGQETR